MVIFLKVACIKDCLGPCCLLGPNYLCNCLWTRHTCKFLPIQIMWQNGSFRSYLRNRFLERFTRNRSLTMNTLSTEIHSSSHFHVGKGTGMLASLASLTALSSLSPSSLLPFRPRPPGVLSFTPFTSSVYWFLMWLCVLIPDVTLDLIVLCLCCIWAKAVLSDADS